jgi:LmbE family N-acetylglucosaminyl deacetylase
VSAPSLTGHGTPEEAWWGPGGLDTVPTRDPAEARPSGRVVVVAPHPDDEVLGVGGTLAVWAAAGTEVAVVAVTDGEGSHPGSPTTTPAALAARRAEERRDALAVLGVEAAVARLRLPDSAVAAGDVADALGDLLRAGDTVVVPVDGDGHPDHDAVAEVAAGAGVPVLGYAVWWWHWAEAGQLRPGAVVVEPDAAARQAKRDAVACFRTQVEPLSDHPADAAILPPPVLERLVRRDEVLWR